MVNRMRLTWVVSMGCPQWMLIALLVGQTISLETCSSSPRPDYLLVECARMEQVSENRFETQQPIHLQIRNTEPQRIPKFPTITNLTVLILKNNRISEIEDEAFFNLNQIQEMDLSVNALASEEVREEIFRGPFSREYDFPLTLRKLNLSTNEIKILRENVFIHLPHLEQLDLSNNPIGSLAGSTAKALLNLLNLKSLYLKNAQIKTIELIEEFQPKKYRIENIYLDGNLLTQVPETLTIFGNTLEILSVNNNPIDYIDEESFLGLNSLKEILLSQMSQLVNIRVHSFSRLPNLTTLICSDNKKLEYIDEQAFSNTTSLRHVSFYNNSLENLPKELLPWEKLEFLNLAGNHWLCNCELNLLRGKILERLKKVDPTILREIKCWKPVRFSDKSIIELTSSGWRCRDWRPANAPFPSKALILSGLSFLIFMVIISLSLYIRHKQRNDNQIHFTQLINENYVSSEI